MNKKLVILHVTNSFNWIDLIQIAKSKYTSKDWRQFQYLTSTRIFQIWHELIYFQTSKRFSKTCCNPKSFYKEVMMTWWFDGKILKILFFLQSGNTLAPTMMPIVQQPRRPLGRESFRQRNIQGCVPQNMVFRQDQPNLNIDNCFVLKSQLRRYFIHYFCSYKYKWLIGN